MLNRGRSKKQVDWRAYWYGTFVGLIPWFIMWFLVARVIIKYDVPLDFIPWWVWAILVEYFLCFWCFPINMTL